MDPVGDLRFGVMAHVTDRSIGVRSLAIEVETRSFASIWLSEHTHIPVAQSTPPPQTGGAPLPEFYRWLLDPIVALTAAAAVTSRLELGTGVLLAAQRDPISTAKALATLDQLSDGRVALGVGYGWNVDEMVHHGVEPRRRPAQLREHVLAMQALWSEDVAERQGEFVAFGPSWSWPKPVQHDPRGRPAVPVLVGGPASDRVFEHVAEFGTGWFPGSGKGLGAALPGLRRRCADQGRSLGRVVVPAHSMPSSAQLDYYAGLGVTDVLLACPHGGYDELMPLLDEFTVVVAEWTGEEGPR